jgi:coenzyme F420-reducing hydrogenase gamma subunit
MTEQPIKVWGVAFMAEKQKDAVLAHCFGDCGKISIAGVIDAGQIGGLAVCCEPTCPYVAMEMDEPYGQTNSFGKVHDVYLRCLTPEVAAPKDTAG